jgi:hypothetical protein
VSAGRTEQGRRLRNAREAAGYRSARDAALQNEWPESSYRAHENGTRTIGQDDAERYASRFRAAGVDVTAQSILFGPDPADGFRETQGAYESGSQPAARPPAKFAESAKPTDADSRGPLDEAPMVACSDLGSGDFVTLRVMDDSMNRISPPGSVIIVDRSQRRLVSGRPYVFLLKGQKTYKIWNATPMYFAASSIQTYAPIFVKRREFSVIGKVVRTMFDP